MNDDQSGSGPALDRMTLEKAEQFFHHVAASPVESDTDAAFRVFVIEYDRRAARITELEQWINVPARWITGASATKDPK